MFFQRLKSELKHYHKRDPSHKSLLKVAFASQSSRSNDAMTRESLNHQARKSDGEQCVEEDSAFEMTPNQDEKDCVTSNSPFSVCLPTLNRNWKPLFCDGQEKAIRVCDGTNQLAQNGTKNHTESNLFPSCFDYEPEHARPSEANNEQRILPRAANNNRYNTIHALSQRLLDESSNSEAAQNLEQFSSAETDFKLFRNESPPTKSVVYPKLESQDCFYNSDCSSSVSLLQNHSKDFHSFDQSLRRVQSVCSQPTTNSLDFFHLQPNENENRSDTKCVSDLARSFLNKQNESLMKTSDLITCSKQITKL